MNDLLGLVKDVREGVKGMKRERRGKMAQLERRLERLGSEKPRGFSSADHGPGYRDGGVGGTEPFSVPNLARRIRMVTTRCSEAR